MIRSRTRFVTPAIVVVAAVGAPLLARSMTEGRRNLVTNGSFSSSVSGWAGWNAHVAWAATGASDGGSAHLAPIGSSKSFALFTEPRPVVRLTAGATYGATARSRGSTGEVACLTLREWSREQRLISHEQSCMRLTARWRAFSPLHYTTRVDGTDLELQVVFGRQHQEGSGVVDDVRLFQVHS